MAGEHIALLRLLRLKNALRSTILSKEWINLRIFHADSALLMNQDFWKLLFVMGRALYAPMRLLRLADHKTSAMDKLYFYVLQTDRMLPKYLQDAEDRTTVFLMKQTMSAMIAPSTAGLTSGSGDEDDDDVIDDDDLFGDNDLAVSSDDDE